MFGVTLGSLYVHVQDCVPALLENLRGLCLALELIGSWGVVGFSVGMEAFGWSHYLMFHVVRSFLVFSGFGLKSPASGFQSYSSSSLKTFPTIQH